jgi:hypothetical protein
MDRPGTISITSTATISDTGAAALVSPPAGAFASVPELPHAASATVMPSQMTSRFDFISRALCYS